MPFKPGSAQNSTPDVTQSELDGVQALTIGACVHNGSAYPSRPSGYAFVIWRGPSDPSASMSVGDWWENTT